MIHITNQPQKDSIDKAIRNLLKKKENIDFELPLTTMKTMHNELNNMINTLKSEITQGDD